MNYQTSFIAKKQQSTINYLAEGLKLKPQDRNWQKKKKEELKEENLFSLKESVNRMGQATTTD